LEKMINKVWKWLLRVNVKIAFTQN
jgi:hypothetical protein